MKDLIARLRRTGALFLIGFFLILYIAAGSVYLQQGVKQRDFEAQSTKATIVISQPLPSPEKLKAEYDEVNRSLSPLTAKEALDIVVNIAQKSGIDVDPASGKFNIPPPASREEEIGKGRYQVLSLRSIHVQGDDASVMAFISDMDSGKTMKTMVLRNISLSHVEVRYQEETRRAEFRNVASAVSAMMADNKLVAIPAPMSYARGTATNLMGDDSTTVGMLEGFPDNTTPARAPEESSANITTAATKGYTGTGNPRAGYVLYRHDKIGTDNTTFSTVNYINVLKTQWYYTCEANGTVRQFDKPFVGTATEYLDIETVKTETIATLDVDIYTKGGKP